MSKVNILIVEDEKIIAMNIKRTLMSFGFDDIEIAVSGEQAIQKAEGMHPDVILMDIVLKGKMDGIEAAEKIKEQFNIPIIYITSCSDDKTVQRAMLTKPIGYLLKPFNDKDLRQGIETALQHR